MSGEDKKTNHEHPEAKVKVTDKRMFGPNGELREEYRFLEDEGAAESASRAARDTAAARMSEPVSDSAPAERSPTAQAPAPQSSSAPSAATEASAPEPEPAAGRPLEIPTGPAGPGSPSFLDLLSIVAEPVAIYLGDVPLPDGNSAENLEMARLYIDLLDVLRRKTVGNLTAQESAALENVLYSLRVRYVQKRG